MKLNDVYTKPLKDVVEELNLTDMKVHTDDEEAIRDVPAAGHHQIHERTSGRLECGQSNR